MKKGDILDMGIVRLETNEYGSRFILKYGDRDTYRVKAFDFQIEGDHPATIRVKVVDIDPMNGLPKLIQDNEWALEQTFKHYDLVGRNYEFEVVDKKVDCNTNASYLCLKDDFGIRFHRYYTNEEYSIGDRIRLYVKEIKCGYLVLTKPGERTKISKVDNLVFSTRDDIEVTHKTSSQERQPSSNKEYKFAENESMKLEYKSSIVFDSTSNEPSVDRQIRKILKSIAGFMNAEGGTLYIGVKDDGRIRGIDGDFEYLNNGSLEYDEYTGQYKKDIDGFENKIRNSVSQHLSSLAGGLIKFQAEHYDNKVVAKIEVSKAYAPIYYHGQIVFQRQGNRTIALKDNMLTHFCASKWFGAESAPKLQEDSTKKNEGIKVDSDNDTRDNSIWHTLNLHSDGGWSFDNNADGKLSDIILSCDIEKYRAKEKHRLLVAYKSGNVNVVQLDKNPDWANKKGWSKNGYITEQKLYGVYCANPMDMVAVFYEKDEKTFVKVVDIDCIGAHSQLHNQGNELAPKDAKDCQIFHIHHKYHDSLRGLTRSSKNYEGFDVDNNTKVRSVIQRLQEIIREEYGVTFE